jgi:hypothetical protein
VVCYGHEAPPSRKLLHARASAEQEIARLEYEAGRRGMRVLAKSAPHTWRDAGPTRSNLDHVVAADHLKFKSFGAGVDVDVLGWPELPADAQKDWIGKFSDHALLYFEVQAV